MLSIAGFTHRVFKLSPKVSATIQLFTCIGLFALMIICSDFFVALSIYLVLFCPLLFMYYYCADGVLKAFKYLNVTA